MVGGQPGLLALAMKPNGTVRQCHRIDRAIAATVEAAAEEGWDIEGVVDEGNFLVRMALAAIWVLLIRHSVTTSMAVGQLAIFRSVTQGFGDVSKIARCAHLIGIVTE